MSFVRVSLVWAFLGCLSIVPFMANAETSVEERVRTYFADVPIMIEIARCESKFTQFDSSGGVLRGGMGKKMLGVFQIYDDVHTSYALSKGMDITALEGNLAYARHLYEREGTTPWNSSSACWNNAHDSLSLNFSVGMVHPQVKILQRLLNASGFPVASEGDGAPGLETKKFGTFTKAAVQKFQCAKGIACDGDESTTGYGFVGPRTRAALLGASPTAASQASASASAYTSEQQVEIARLQAQIAELTRLLNQLLQA